MRHWITLIEYNQSMTRNKYQDSLDKRFEQDNHHVISDPNDIIPYFEKLDPTKKKAFVLLFIRWYLDGSMRYLEDAPKAVSAIKEVMKYRNTLTDWKNLSFGAFLDLGDSLSKQVSQSEENKAEEQKFYADGEAQVFVDDADVKIIIPKTEAASCYFGKGTRWCTSADNDNMFDYYNKDGDLYIIIFRKDGPHWKKGDKWQFHFSSEQFMDATDEEIPEDEMAPLLRKYFQKQIINMIRDNIGLKFIEYIDKPPQDIQNDVINYNPYMIARIKNPSISTQIAAIQQSSESFSYISRPSEKIKQYAVERFGGNIQYIENPTEKLQMIAVKKGPTNIKYIKHPTVNVQKYVLVHNPSLVRFIDDVSEEALDYGIEQYNKNN